jgi:transcriptional regulator with XRE-family HTH domain
MEGGERMEDSKLYERLREIRMQHGYTQESLAETLGVNPQAVKSWEKHKGSSDPKLKNLLAMCELYDCDLDYLVGRIQESTHDINFVHEFTGLSEEAIQKISNKELNHPFGNLLSCLIESDYFYNLMTSYKIFLVSAEKLSSADIDEPPFELDDGDRVVLSCNEATHHFMRKVSSAMMHICEDEYLKRMAEASNNAHRKKLERIDSIVNEIRKQQGKE